MSTIRFCPSCGTASVKGTRFCVSCGSDLGASAAATRPATQAALRDTAPGGRAASRSSRADEATGPWRTSRSWLQFAVIGSLGLVVVGVVLWVALPHGTTSPPGSTGDRQIVPPVEEARGDWPIVRLGDTGVSFRYPPAWHVDDQSDGLAIVLREPDSSADRPEPTIGISFAPGAPAEPPDASAGMSAPQSIIVAHIQGWAYYQMGLAVPSAAAFIDLPYRGGLLRFTATRGPGVSLEQQLDEILKTLELSP